MTDTDALLEFFSRDPAVIAATFVLVAIHAGTLGYSVPSLIAMRFDDVRCRASLTKALSTKPVGTFCD